MRPPSAETASRLRRPISAASFSSQIPSRLVPEHMPPKCIPVGAGNVGHPAVLFEKLVGHLKHGKHKPALGRAGDVAAAGLAPDELAGTDAQALGRTFLIDQPALEHISLLDLDM